MKKIIFVFGLMLAMIACSGNTTTSNKTNDSTTVDSIVDSTLVDTISIN